MKSETIATWYKKILQYLTTDTVLEETLIHDIILFQRESAHLDALKLKKSKCEMERDALYVPYLKFVEYIYKTWLVISKLQCFSCMYVFSQEMFIAEYTVSLAQLSTDANFLLHPDSIERAANILAGRLGKKVGDWLAPSHRVWFLVSITLVKWAFLEKISECDLEILLDILTFASSYPAAALVSQVIIK